MRKPTNTIMLIIGVAIIIGIGALGLYGLRIKACPHSEHPVGQTGISTLGAVSSQEQNKQLPVKEESPAPPQNVKAESIGGIRREPGPGGIGTVHATTVQDVEISWIPVENTDSYNIYWSDTPGVTKEPGTRITNVSSPYVHRKLNPGRRYYYIVTSSSQGKESLASQQVSAKPEMGIVAFTIGGSGSIHGLPSLFHGTWIEIGDEGKEIARMEVKGKGIDWTVPHSSTQTIEATKVTIAEDQKMLSFTSDVVIAEGAFIPSPAIVGKPKVEIKREDDILVVKIGEVKLKSGARGLFRWRGGTSISFEVVDGKEVAVITRPEKVHRYVSIEVVRVP